MSSAFALAPGVNAQALADEFHQRRRVRIEPFLTEDSVHALRDHLRSRDDWRLVVNGGEKVFEIDRAGQRAMTAEQWRQFDKLVEQSAAQGFQFRFETIRVPDDEEQRRKRGTLLDEFALFLSSPGMVDFFRQLTGAARIAFADAQATSYSAGHFLTTHDDDVDGKERQAAYVFGLTESWRPDWGGLLRFHTSDGEVEEAWLPRFNALTVFRVPQLHSVSAVAPIALGRRHSVTGWLRAKS